MSFVNKDGFCFAMGNTSHFIFPVVRCSIILWCLLATAQAQQPDTGVSFSRSTAFARDILVDRSAAMADGGMVLAGPSYYPVLDPGVLISRTDSIGNCLWSVYLKGTAIGRPTGLNIDKAGNIFCSGTYLKTDNTTDIYIVKFFPDGSVCWSGVYDLGGNDRTYGQELLSNGNLLIVGAATGNHYNGALLFSYDTAGTIVWCKIRQIDPIPQQGPSFITAAQLTDTSFVVAGPIQTAGGTIIAIESYSFSGNLIAPSAFMHGSDLYSIRSIKKLHDGSIVVGGSLLNADEAPDETPLVFKFDSTLVPQWGRRISSLRLSEKITELIEEDTMILAAMVSETTTTNSEMTHVGRWNADGILTNISQLFDVKIPLQIVSICRGPKDRILGAGSGWDKSIHSLLKTFSLTPRLDGCAAQPMLCTIDSIAIAKINSQPMRVFTLYPGRTNQTITIVATQPLASTLNCSNTATVVDRSTDSLNAISLTLWPNPSPQRSVINIYLRSISTGYCKISLRNIASRIVLEVNKQVVSGEHLEFPTTSLASGIYFIELADANSFATLWRGKVVVQ